MSCLLFLLIVFHSIVLFRLRCMCFLGLFLLKFCFVFSCKMYTSFLSKISCLTKHLTMDAVTKSKQHDNMGVVSSCICTVQWAYGIPMWLSVFLSVYLWKCFFSNISWWIFVILGYNGNQVGDNRDVQDFGVKCHLGSFRVIVEKCSNRFFVFMIR